MRDALNVKERKEEKRGNFRQGYLLELTDWVVGGRQRDREKDGEEIWAKLLNDNACLVALNEMSVKTVSESLARPDAAFLTVIMIKIMSQGRSEARSGEGAGGGVRLRNE